MKILIELLTQLIMTIVCIKNNYVYVLLMFYISYALFLKSQKRANKYIILFFIISLLVGYKTYNIENYKNPDIKTYEYQNYNCKVISVSRATNSIASVVKVYDEDTKKYTSKVQAYFKLENEGKIKPGYNLVLKGILLEPSKATNDGEFNEYEYLKNKGIHYKFLGDIEDIKIKNTINTHIYDFREYLLKLIDESFDNKYSGIIKNMILSEKGATDKETKELYREGGIIHILAISGMHIGIISSFILAFLSVFKVKKSTKKIIVMIVIFFYYVLTGMNVSTLRAVIMIDLMYIGEILERDYDSKNGILVAAIIMLYINPLNLFDIGFLLSFIATLSMKYNLSIFKTRYKSINSINSNISVFLMTFPIIIYNFYEVNVLSILINILIVPFVSIIMTSSICVLALAKFNNFASSIISKLPECILEYYDYVLNFFSNIEIGKLKVGSISIVGVISFYAIYYLLYKYLRNNSMLDKDILLRKTYKNLIIGIVVVNIFILVVGRSDLVITMYDIKHGDSILVELNNSLFDTKNILIDGGGIKLKYGGDVAERIVYQNLKYKGISHIDTAIVTHPDKDHIKGIIELIDLIEIDEIIVPKYEFEGNKYMYTLKSKAKEKGIPIKEFCKGMSFNSGKHEFICVSPESDEEIEESDSKLNSNNNKSVCFVHKYKDKKFFYTGDIEVIVEKLIIKDDFSKDLIKDVELLKAPHHGLSSSNSKEFIKHVSPNVLIASGDYDDYKIFRNNIKRVYEYEDTKVYYTAKCGMVELKY